MPESTPRPFPPGRAITWPPGPPDPLVDALAADLCDQGSRPARSEYHPRAWEDALARPTPWPGGCAADYWRAYARHVIAWVHEYAQDVDGGA